MLFRMEITKDLAQLGHELQGALDGRTQTWLSEEAGVPQPQISRLIHGTINDPKARYVVPLARALKRSPRRWLALAGIELPEEARFLDDEVLYWATRLQALPDDLRALAIDAAAGVIDSYTDLARRTRTTGPERATYAADPLPAALPAALEAEWRAAMERCPFEAAVIRADYGARLAALLVSEPDPKARAAAMQRWQGEQGEKRAG